MQPSTTEFATAITQNNQLMCAKAEIWSPPPNPECLYSPLNIVEGSSADDETSRTRRTASLTIVDATGGLTISEATDLLHPLSGNEIRPYRGLVLPGGPEYIPCGVYRNRKPSSVVMTSGGVKIDLALSDRMEPFSTYGWVDPFTVSGNITAIIYNTLEEFMPGLDYNFDISGYIVNEVPTLVWGGLGNYTASQISGNGTSDPASGMTDLATAAALELFFDAAGVATFRTITIPATRAVNFQWSEGGLAEGPVREFDITQWYNTVVAQAGTASIQAGIQATAFLPPKPNPCVPYTYTSPAITSEAQAYACAVGILYRLQFAMETVILKMPPDPRVNAGDTARLDYPSARIEGVYVVQNVKMPWTAREQMEVTLRPVALAGVATFGLPGGG